jgi:hypothetical protein
VSDRYFDDGAVSALNATNLLAAWEQGIPQHPFQRAVTLLHLAWPEKSSAEWASVPVGERDRELLRLREKLFGPKIEATAECPKCSSQLEITFTARDLQLMTAEPATTALQRVISGEYEIDYRLPTTMDLLEAANGSERPMEVLLHRCVTARYQDQSVQPGELPAAVVEMVGKKMAEADPYAEIQIELDCAGCSHQWAMVFDVVSYFWSEVEDWAIRLLRDVHSLASAYGWSELDIIKLSARRRRLYLELAYA